MSDGVAQAAARHAAPWLRTRGEHRNAPTPTQGQQAGDVTGAGPSGTRGPRVELTTSGAAAAPRPATPS
eukprot:10007802-Alexandrium_andersonii.AAC.1